MIYLITGNMGTGKTSKVVQMIIDNEDGLFEYKVEDGTTIKRPLYFCHIDGLDTKKLGAIELTEEEIMSAPLDELLPEGAVLIVDEAHYTYPPRSSSREVPQYIQKLTELRHNGHTLILMTQHPMQLDIFVRNLVSRHYHLERKAVGSKQYSFYKCVTNLDSPATVSGVESKAWRPPKKAFGYYKSASTNVKFVRKVPMVLFLLIFVLCGIAFFGYRVFQDYDKATGGDEVKEQVVQAAASSTYVEGTSESADFGQDDKVVGSEAMDYVPRLSDKPETKPIYDSVRKVVAMETVAACISGGLSGCTCYTDRGTPLEEISKADCRKYATKGLPFNPYRGQVDSGGVKPSDVK